ncbi:16S rRNA (adenine(1518)-N(6)/adenine(1519)-N(6))-dimethyltransferase RsmA [Rickettsiales bacterium]|nr:16S rRNA (adenine(1518)-N(6)/adenine(1519)-N(6))-dimethyltransferase RsmA [Rickettsiales bacterium]
MTIKADKKLSQNFLLNKDAVNLMADLASRHSRFIVEIGVGTGNITNALLNISDLNHIIGIEKDSRMKESAEEIEKNSKIDIVFGDALKIGAEEISKLFAEKSQDFNVGDKMTLVGNLPYSVGSRIVLNAIKEISYYDGIVVILQSEVINKIVAKTSSSDYSKLSVMTQVFCDVEKVMSLSQEDFKPAPKVKSAMVYMRPKNKLCDKLYNVVDKFTNIGFGQRRKTLMKNVSNQKNDELKKVVESHIEPMQRMQELSPQKILSICEEIMSKGIDI